MSPSNSAYKLIIAEEGLRLKAYPDSAGVATIGYGSTMYDDGRRVQLGDVITKERAMQLLEWEVQNKSKSIAAMVSNVVLNQNQFDALVSFAYNVGVGALAGSTLLKVIKRNPSDPYIRAAFSMWDKITDPATGKKVVLSDLTRRRQHEADLYFS